MTAARSCTRCHSPVEREDLRCAVCALPVPAADRPAQVDPEEAVARILRCNGCGAAVRYRAEVQAPRCDFCASVMEVQTPDDPVEQAEAFLPFTVDPEQARAALRAWLGRLGFFRPPDLQTRAAVDALRPLWWVGWTFDAEGTMSWAADSNAGARRSAWAPHAGQAPLSVRNVVVPASRGLTSAECRGLVPRYRLGEAGAQPQAPASTTSAEPTVEQFAVQRSAARRIVTEALEGVARGLAARLIPGARHRKLGVAVLPTRLVSRRFAFPAYVLAYRYRDEVYRAIVHGQDGGCVLGEAPWAWGRIAAVVLGALALIAAVVIVVTAAS